METKTGSQLTAGLTRAAFLGRASARPRPRHKEPPGNTPSASGTGRFSVARAEHPAVRLGLHFLAQGEAGGRK